MGERLRPRRRAADGRAGDRDRQHLQARHALLRAARRQLPRRDTAPSCPIWMGSYGIGPARIVAAAVEQFADEHGISWPRALAPFAVHLVGARQARHARARRRRRGCTTTLLRGRGRGALRRPRPRPGREVRRRRAARLPAAADGRAPLAGVRRDRGAGAPRPRRTPRACPWTASPRSCCGRWTSCGGASPRARRERGRRAGERRRARLTSPPVRPRPLRAAAAADAGRAAAAAVDDPQRDRLRAARADPGVPDRGALAAATAPARWPRRCSR